MQHVQLNDYRNYDELPEYCYVQNRNHIRETTNFDDLYVETIISINRLNIHMFMYYDDRLKYIFDGVKITSLSTYGTSWNINFHMSHEIKFLHDHECKTCYILPTKYGHCNLLCFYFDINAHVMLSKKDEQFIEIEMMTYEDPYADDEVYEGTIKNALDFPRVIHYDNETYIRVTFNGRESYNRIFSTHKILCVGYKTEN